MWKYFTVGTAMTHPGLRNPYIRKIVVLFLIVFWGSLAVIIINYNHYQVSDSDAAYINLAGRQRMLSQKILAFSNQHYLAKLDASNVLQNTVKEFDQSLNIMEYGGTALDREFQTAPKELRAPLSKVRRLWSSFRQEVYRLINTSSTKQQRNQAHQYILRETNNLTALSNEVVVAYENRIETKRHHTLYFLLTTSLLISFAMALGIWLFRRFVINKEAAENFLNQQVKQHAKGELALQKSEQRLQAVIDNAADGIITTNRSGVILTANPAGLRIFGYKKDELIGKSISILMPESEKRKHETYIKKYYIIGASKILKNKHRELIAMRADGSHFHIELSVNEIKSRDYHEFIGLVRDISQKKKYEEQLQDLTQHLHEVREEEQKRIARELHDEFGQSLTALTLDASWMIDQVPPERPECRKRLRSMIKLIDNTAQSVRRLTVDLRPPVLDHFGLDSALQWYTEDFENRSGIQCHLTISDEVQSLDEKQSVTTFRIFQETLTNVARHANASEIKVNLVMQKQRLYMDIKDNGIGFDIDDETIQKNRFGIMGMKERAMVLNGEVEIASEPGSGTVVTMSFPIGRESNRIKDIRVASGQVNNPAAS